MMQPEPDEDPPCAGGRDSAIVGSFVAEPAPTAPRRSIYLPPACPSDGPDGTFPEPSKPKIKFVEDFALWKSDALALLSGLSISNVFFPKDAAGRSIQIVFSPVTCVPGLKVIFRRPKRILVKGLAYAIESNSEELSSENKETVNYILRYSSIVNLEEEPQSNAFLLTSLLPGGGKKIHKYLYLEGCSYIGVALA